jgi:hypothetical protein
MPCGRDADDCHAAPMLFAGYRKSMFSINLLATKRRFVTAVTEKNRGQSPINSTNKHPAKPGGHIRGSRHAENYRANDLGHRNHLRACDLRQHAERRGALASALGQGRSSRCEAGAQRGAGPGCRSGSGRRVGLNARFARRPSRNSSWPGLSRPSTFIEDPGPRDSTRRCPRLPRSGARPKPPARSPRC